MRAALRRDNHLAIFVTGGSALREYLGARRAAGEMVLHFVLEPNRLARLRSELGPIESLAVLTDRQASDKFCLVRAVLL